MGRMTLIFLAAVVAQILSASACAEEWVRRYNGPGNADDLVCGVAVDDSDNAYVTGTSLDVNTKSDYVTIKYRSTGVEESEELKVKS